MLGTASRACPKNSRHTVRVCLGMRCKIQRPLVIKPSQPSFCMPGKPDKNLSVTSLPKPTLRNACPAMSSLSRLISAALAKGLLPSRHTSSNVAVAASWILPTLCPRRVTSSQFPCGSTMRQDSKLSRAVPHNTAFLPPAFMAILPPMQDASALVGSTANTRPVASAASDTRLVTTPAPDSITAYSRCVSGRVCSVTALKNSSFSVLMTALRQLRGTAPPVYPVPPPRGTIVKPKAIQALTKAGISSSVSGVRTTKGYSTRQSVASVTWETRDKPSNLILSFSVTRAKVFFAAARNAPTSSSLAAKAATAVLAAFNNSATFSARFCHTCCNSLGDSRSACCDTSSTRRASISLSL